MNASFTTNDVRWFFDESMSITEYHHRLIEERGFAPEAAASLSDQVWTVMYLLEERLTVADYREQLLARGCAELDAARAVEQMIHTVNELRIVCDSPCVEPPPRRVQAEPDYLFDHHCRPDDPCSDLCSFCGS